jgi:Tol biopolymer transport system component
VSLSANGEYAVFSGHRVLSVKATNAKHHRYSLDLFLWDHKKGALHLLTGASSYAHDDHPSISADGNLIAFRTLDETSVKTAGIRLFNRKTDKFIDLPNLSFHSNTGIPCLSPDGRYLFFSAQTLRGDRDVYLYDRDVSKLIDLPNVNSAVDEWSARVSKGGRFLAFCSRRAEEKVKGEALARVLLYDREGGKFVDLPNLNVQAKHLECDLSSDGRFLALVIDRKEVRLHDRETGKTVEMPKLAHQGRGIVHAALSRE